MSCVGIYHISVFGRAHLIVVEGDAFRLRRLDTKAMVGARDRCRALHCNCTPNLHVDRDVGEDHDAVASTLGLAQGTLQPL